MDATAASSGSKASGHDNNAGDGGKKKKDGAAAKSKKVSLFGMFQYADRLDVLLMVVGTVGAVANGMAEPLMTLLFGNVINSFGQSTTETILRSVRKVGFAACASMNSCTSAASSLLIVARRSSRNDFNSGPSSFCRLFLTSYIWALEQQLSPSFVSETSSCYMGFLIAVN
jgi:hypothetical protein